MTVDTAAPPGPGAGAHEAGDEAEPVSAPGRGELGTISLSNRVVEKLAARAAVEVPDAGAAAPRILGRSMGALSSSGPMGVRETNLDSLPKTSADVDGSIVVLDLKISVRWPASIPGVTKAVREHVRARVGELTGLTVSEIQIEVTDLVTSLAPQPRVK